MLDIFVISLTHSVERRERVKKKLEELNVIFSFVDAIDTKSHDFSSYSLACSNTTKKCFGYELTPSEMACFASHRMMWEKCIELGKPIIVMEDNISVKPQFVDVIAQFETLSNAYVLIKLQAIKKRAFITIQDINQDHLLVKLKKRSSGASSYIITPIAAKALLKNSHIMVEPVDEYIDKAYKHQVNVLSLHPNIIVRDNVESIIGSNRKNKDSLKWWSKIYIEAFRIYENFQYFQYFKKQVKCEKVI